MNLFFIESPLQALNAIEFVSCKDNKQGKDLFIILSDGTMSETNLAQIEFVLNFFGYDDKVIFNINGGVKSLFLHREQVRMLAKRYSKYNIEYCVIGEYRSLASRVLINKIKPKKVVTVDDGTATLRIERSKKPSVKIRLITTLCKFGLGFDITLKQGVHFFSVYDISNKLTKGDCLHTNRYSFLKSKLYDYPKSNKHFIIGSPLKEAGVVKEDIILTIKKIDKIVSLTKSKKSDLVYIAHRRESDSKLSVIENYDVRVEKLSYPFELYSLVNKERVSRIHCFYSSVLTNFLELDDDVIGNSYIIGPEFINSKFREFVSSVYSNYQSQKHPRLELFSIRDDE